MEIVSLYGQGYVVDKQTVPSELFRINRYVVQEPAPHGRTLSLLDEQTDVEVGDYVYVYLVEANDAMPRTKLVKYSVVHTEPQ